MTTNNVLFLEGQSKIKPPMFSSSHFSSRKQRMEVFLQSIDIKLWFIINLDLYETTSSVPLKVPYFPFLSVPKLCHLTKNG